MKNRKHSFLPSIADVLFISVFFFLSFSAGKGLLADCDTGYHIRAGEFILKTLSVPKHDIFSFITPPIPWTAHEWLSEVIMALVHRAFGLTGIVLFFAFVIAFAYYLFFKIIKADKPNIIVAAFIMALVIASSEIHWLARPHIFSLFIIMVWYTLLDAYQYKDKNYLYLLPPLTLLWVNLHGGFISGLILIGIYLFGNLFKFMISMNEEREEWKRKTGFLGVILLACLLSALINPYGYHILLFPFKLTSSRFIMDHVSEFISPNFHEPMIFTYLLLLMMAVFAFSRSTLNIVEISLMTLFTYMALYSARYIPLFGIITAPIMTIQSDLIIKQSKGRFSEFLRKRAERIASTDASARGYLWLIVAVLTVVVFAARGRIEYGFDEKAKPVAAVDFLLKERIKGNMFNNDEFGDYIIYKAWPEYKVFFDGRSDMYGAERMKEYFKVGGIEPGWEEVLKKYDIDWIFYDNKSVLSRHLLGRDDWKLIYSDKVANIFVRNIPKYGELIERYKNIKPAGDK